MSDNSDSSDGNGGNGKSEESLGKQQKQNSKSVTDGIASKGNTAEGNAGEEGGYGFIRPSAESGGSDGDSSGGGGSDGSSGGSDE